MWFSWIPKHSFVNYLFSIGLCSLLTFMGIVDVIRMHLNWFSWYQLSPKVMASSVMREDLWYYSFHKIFKCFVKLCFLAQTEDLYQSVTNDSMYLMVQVLYRKSIFYSLMLINNAFGELISIHHCYWKFY